MTTPDSTRDLTNEFHEILGCFAGVAKEHRERIFETLRHLRAAVECDDALSRASIIAEIVYIDEEMRAPVTELVDIMRKYGVVWVDSAYAAAVLRYAVAARVAFNEKWHTWPMPGLDDCKCVGGYEGGVE